MVKTKLMPIAIVSLAIIMTVTSHSVLARGGYIGHGHSHSHGHSHGHLDVFIGGGGYYGGGFGIGGPGYYGGYGYRDPFFYPPHYAFPPAYAYPPLVVTPATPPIYIEQENVAPTPPPQTNYWYYCNNPDGYYPYVKQCPGGWQQVAPQPAQ